MDRPGRTTAEVSPWAPLRRPVFRWLWVGVLVGYIGVWMQTVGAQWLLVEDLAAGGVVALVQTAATLPVMLLALPAGVLADVFDRRWVLFTVQVYVLLIAGTLALLTAWGQVTAPLLLAFTFLLGLGGAVQLPAWQAVIPELVPRSQLGAATRLEMVGVNFGRSAGPALAGLVIALAGVPAVFALNALSVILFAVVLLRWRGSAESPGPRERFVPALRAGGRYVWFEPVVRRILLRVVLFIGPGAVLWALLPLVARNQLGLGAGGYGVLFAALGLGAIVTAVVMNRVRRRLSTDQLLAAAGIAYAVALLGPGPGPPRRRRPAQPGPGRTGLDVGDLHPERRAAALPAGVGAGPRAGRLPRGLHRVAGRGVGGLGPGHRPGRRPDHLRRRGGRRGRRGRGRGVLAAARHVGDHRRARGLLARTAGRLTAADQEVEEAALALSDPPARVEHLLPP